MIGEIVTLVGALLLLLSAIGTLRFDDALARMHAFAKGSTLGIIVVLVGATLSLTNVNDVTSVLLAIVLLILASPPAESMLSRAMYLSDAIPRRLDVVDEGKKQDEGS